MKDNYVHPSITEEGWLTVNEDILRLEVSMYDGQSMYMYQSLHDLPK